MIISRFILSGFKREALTSWKEFFFLAMAGVGHVTLECICWEVGTFVAGILGTTELAVQSILFQTETILYTVSLFFYATCASQKAAPDSAYTPFIVK